MISVESLVGDGLWVVGLAGVLATFSYVSWMRGVKGWSWKVALSLPAMMAALSFSLFLFSGGMAISSAVSAWPALWWQTIAWSILAVLFAVQAVAYMQAGRRKGWDAPIEGHSNHE